MNSKELARKKTEDKIVRTALRLMAVQGVDAVSMNEVVKASGQGNASAINYYFGNKAGLLQAIFDRHRPAIQTRRQEMIESLESEPTIEQIAEALVLPVIAELDNPDGGMEYLQMLAKLERHELNPAEAVDGRRYQAMADHGDLLSNRFDHLSAREFELSFRAIRNLVIHGLADYSSVVKDSPKEDKKSRPIFTSIMINSIVSILSQAGHEK